MAEGNIILRIGSAMGPGGLASLQAGIGMIVQLGQKIYETVKEAEKFAQVYKRMQIDIREADKATQGLIDTMVLMQEANKFSNAQMQLSAKEYKAIALVATDVAKATGEDVTTSFQRLTRAIQTGQTRALKELGIELKAQKTLQETQAKALELVTERAKGVTVEVETLTEGMYILGNNLGTTAGMFGVLAAQSAGAGGPFADLNILLGDLNAELEELVQRGGSIGGFVLEMAITFTKWNPAIRGIGEGLALISEGLAWVGIIDEPWKPAHAYLADLANEAADAAYQIANENREVKAAQARKRPPKINNSFKVGKKKSEPIGDTMDFTIEDVEQYNVEQEQDLFDAMVNDAIEARDRELALRQAGEGIGDANLSYTTPEEAARQLEEMRELQAEIEAEREERHQRELERQQEMREAYAETFNDISRLAAQTGDDLGGFSKAAGAAGAAIEASSEGGAAAFTAGVGAIVEGTQWEAAVKAAMEYAEAIASFASQDYVGGALHTTAAVAYTVVAAESMSQKKSSIPKGSGASASNPNVGGYQPDRNRQGTSERDKIDVRIKMDEDGWQAIVDKNNKELNYGRNGFAQAT